MSAYEIIKEAPGYFNDGLGHVDIFHENDSKKDLRIAQSNYTLSNDEIIRIYAYCQEHSDVKHVTAYQDQEGGVISVRRGQKEEEIKIDDLPEVDVPELFEALGEKPVAKVAWVSDLKRAVRDGKYVKLSAVIAPSDREKYADLFKKNFENWAKAAKEGKAQLNPIDYNSICYVGGNGVMENDRNAAINPLLIGNRVDSASAESDFALKLAEVLENAPIDEVVIARRFEHNGVMICTFDDDETKNLIKAMPDTVKYFSNKDGKGVYGGYYGGYGCGDTKEKDFIALTEWLEKTNANPEINLVYSTSCDRFHHERVSKDVFEAFLKVAPKIKSLSLDQPGLGEKNPVLRDEEKLCALFGITKAEQEYEYGAKLYVNTGKPRPVREEKLVDRPKTTERNTQTITDRLIERLRQKETQTADRHYLNKGRMVATTSSGEIIGKGIVEHKEPRLADGSDSVITPPKGNDGR